MKQNNQHGSISTNYNLQMWPFKPAKENFVEKVERKVWKPERSVKVNDKGEKCKRLIVIFSSWVCMLLQSISI